jgi:signal peptidase I
VAVIKVLFKLALWVGAILGVVAGILRATAVDIAVVGHNAMAPTMITGEQVFVWRHATPERGDIVICENPSDPSLMVVGRVIAEQGSTVDTPRANILEINGHAVERDVQGTTRFFDVDTETTYEMRRGVAQLGQTDHQYFVNTSYTFRMQPVTVPDGHVFLLSDNLSYLGQDSRAFGPVDVETCVGQIFMRFRPVDDGGAGLDHGYFDILD